METQDTRPLYEEILRLSAAIAENQREASIIFVDLAGSTEFKASHGPVLGLEKTYIHNSLVTKVVGNRAEVVKYIGDEVMIVVKTTDHPAVASRLAIDIQKD